MPGLHSAGVRAWTLRLLGAALIGWCLYVSVAALRLSRARQPDPMAALDAEFKPFAVELPLDAVVGYLEERDGGEHAVRTYYAAQYALAPRVILSRVGPELLIVPRGAAEPGDPRLEGFFQVAVFPSGHRLFRRLVE